MRDRKSKESDVGKETMVAQDENRLFDVSSHLGMSFPDCIRNRYSEDKVYAPVLANPEEFTSFAVRDGLIFFESEGIETVAVPNVCFRNKNVREVLIKQGHSILAHLSDEKAATYMSNRVW